MLPTSFFGLARLIQLVLPGMRRRGGGRILSVSSMGGRVTLPGGAFYHASGPDADGIARVITRAVTARRPRTRYLSAVHSPFMVPACRWVRP